MAIINRITRLFAADLNAVLDRMETPDIILSQALRDMQDDINKDELNEKSLLDEKSYIENKLDDTGNGLLQLIAELDLCFESDEIELARYHVKRKLEIQVYEKNLKWKMDVVNKNLNELSSKLISNKKRLSAMQQKYELLTDKEFQVINEDYYTSMDTPIKEQDVDSAFLQEKQSRGLL